MCNIFSTTTTSGPQVIIGPMLKDEGKGEENNTCPLKYQAMAITDPDTSIAEGKKHPQRRSNSKERVNLKSTSCLLKY